MSQWDYKIDQPMPGPFPFPNSGKGPGIEVECKQCRRVYDCSTCFWQGAALNGKKKSQIKNCAVAKPARHLVMQIQLFLCV